MPPSISRPATPILDLEKPLPKPDSEKWLRGGNAISLVLLILTAVLRSPPLLILVAFVVCFVLLGWFATLTHELGHLAAGYLVSLRFNGITVGPLTCERNRLGWRFRICPPVFGGFTYMSLDKIRRVRKRLAIFTLGGAVGSLSSAMLATLIFFLIFPGEGSPLPLALAAYAVLSFWIGITGLSPSQTEYNDGRILKELRGSREDARRTIASFALNLLKTNGISPGSWKSTWAAAAYQPLRDETYSAIQNYHKSAGLWGAAQNLEACLAQSATLNKSHRELVISEAAFFNAWSRKDTYKAAVWVKRFKDLDNRNPLAHLRVDIAFDCCVGNFESALRNLDSALALLRRAPCRDSEPSWQQWRVQIVDRMMSQCEPGSKLPVMISGVAARCLKCDWMPRRLDRWSCKCGTIWNTFDTAGLCPTCGEQWATTQCLQCGEWSPQPEWMQKVPSVESI